MTTSESKADFFYKRIDSNRELECSTLCRITQRHMIAQGLYTVSQKNDTKLLPITSPNINRFSKLFHF